MGRRNVKILFDCYLRPDHAGRPDPAIEAHLPLIGHVQIAAVPSRAEPDEGEVDYPELLMVLDRLGYDGWVGAEYKPRGRTEDGLAWLRAWSSRTREERD